MSTRFHDHARFFKYTSLETALKVIESKKFRWTSPTLFNDPFDHQSGLIATYDSERFANLLTESVKRIVFDDVQPVVDPLLPLGLAALRLRGMRDRLPKDEVLASLREASLGVATGFHEHIDQLNEALREKLCNSRVFCVSEVCDNVVMWSHYADEHRGAVFDLSCVDELDNTLLAAHKVEYSDQFLKFPEIEEYVQHLTGERSFDLLPLVWKIAFTKHSDWSYEREWRIHLPLLGQSIGEGFSYESENPRVFAAVYLGCRAPEVDVQRVLDAVKLNFPHMKVYRAVKSTVAFALEFEQLYAG